jgi:uncharacterized protein YdeI (YjbR/CyaY-like superfamily)
VERFTGTLGERGLEIPFDAKDLFGEARPQVRGTVEYAPWIAEAKKEETRERRVANAIEMLREGVKHP